MEPSAFYTGLVAELYAPLRATVTDPEPYARFIARSGEPALELGCGDGEPLLDLRSRGLDVEGLDSSPDMLRRCREAAARRGLDVVLHQQQMEAMDLPGRYRSIFLAGATFTLLPDDDTTRRALLRIRAHLAPGGSALIPLFIPEQTELGQRREVDCDDGSLLRVTTIGQERNERERRQTNLLRYERVDGDATTAVERPWTLHWHTQTGFAELARSAGLRTGAILDAEGGPAADTADVFVFWLAVDGDDQR
ncbi:MAG: class I SAM-dependent methyltransferase [Actinomycetota bacterium]|nr:class I SAM-dependent methyltransferase [Actinomycetota bacterium]